MVVKGSDPICLIYLPLSYNGKGPGESCVQIISQFLEIGIKPLLFLPRARKPISASVTVFPTLPFALRQLPWRWIATLGQSSLDKQFEKALREMNPKTTIVYFWPDAPLALVVLAKKLGFICVREMINSPCENAKNILDHAYSILNLPMAHSVNFEKVQLENHELILYDYLFSSNDEVDKALICQGIEKESILTASFGWNPDRFASGVANMPRPEGLRFVFVGSINVRKGIPELLEAWKRADIVGELCLAGQIEPCLQSMLDEHVSTGRVKYLGFVDNVANLYYSSDVFIFPTLEEGGPQVTYEAAGCGLPVITTPMGSARLVVSGKNGIVVSSGSIHELTVAIKEIEADEEKRKEYGRAALQDASQFLYRKVGNKRGCQLRDILKNRNVREYITKI